MMKELNRTYDFNALKVFYVFSRNKICTGIINFARSRRRFVNPWFYLEGNGWSRTALCEFATVHNETNC